MRIIALPLLLTPISRVLLTKTLLCYLTSAVKSQTRSLLLLVEAPRAERLFWISLEERVRKYLEQSISTSGRPPELGPKCHRFRSPLKVLIRLSPAARGRLSWMRLREFSNQAEESTSMLYLLTLSPK